MNVNCSIERGHHRVTVGERHASGIVHVLAIDPTAPTTLYAGLSPDGVFKSTDGGQSWTAMNTGLTSITVRDIALDPRNPSTLYASTAEGVFKTSPAGAVFKSTDGGASWTAMSTGLTSLSVSHLAINSLTGSTLYAGTNDGVFDFQIPLSP